MNAQEEKIEFNGAMIFGAMVYVGVVLAMTVMFISFVLTAFPKDAYLTRVVMSLAGLLVGSSMVAFPVALHIWIVEKIHRTVATILYYAEMLVMVVNTVVAFITLLSKNSGYAAPEWAVLYEPFSVAAIGFTLFAWGTVFLMDPAHRARQQKRQFESDFSKKVAALKLTYLDTAEGHASIQMAADAEVQETIAAKKAGTKHWGENVATPAPAPFVAKQAVSPSPLPETDGENS